MMKPWRKTDDKGDQDEADEKGLLSGHEQSIDFEPDARNDSFTWAKVGSLTVAIMLSALAILGFIIYFSTPHGNLTDCGGLNEQERARFCRFDIMSFSWLPPECYDQELIDEFNSVKEWGYWEHKRGLGGRVTYEEANKGLRDLYVSWEHHRHHCIYMWKKLHRAVVMRRPIDSYVGNYGHTAHCDKMLFSEETSNMSIALVNSPIIVKTPSCGMDNWNIPGNYFR